MQQNQVQVYQITEELKYQFSDSQSHAQNSLDNKNAAKSGNHQITAR